MSVLDLLPRINERSARIGVIGLGYVGLPVACILADNGFEVTGVDINQQKVETINAGQSPIGSEEPGIAELAARVVASGKLHASTDVSDLAEAHIVLICVDTPVEPDTHTPLYRGLRSALSGLGTVLGDGALVVIESTIAPGTISGVVIPALQSASGKQAGVDFYVGHCPERVTPGRLLQNLITMSRAVGGQTPEVAEVMVALYSTYVTGELDPTDPLTAEVVKTAENAYRDVQIAFANELAVVCETLGADVYAVRDLLNKSPGRAMLMPGAGVGGHCIPKDPWLLIANARNGVEPRLIPAARAVNDRMPKHMATLTENALRQHGLELKGACIAVLGYAFREDTDDDRESPSRYFVEALERRGATAVVHDPHVPTYQRPLEEVVTGANAVVFMVGHRAYLDIDLGWLRQALANPIIVDGRNVIDADAAASAGFTYTGVGRRLR